LHHTHPIAIFGIILVSQQMTETISDQTGTEQPKGEQ
jgi:hypothetical protein